MWFNFRYQINYYLIIVMAAFSNLAIGQTEKEIEDQVQFWTSINSTTRLSNHWGVMGDFHIRRNNFIKDPSFYFLRLGGVYWIDDKFSLAGGTAALWLATEVDNEFDFALEKRLFQQVLWRTSFDKVRFLQRIRTEQRWHEILDAEGSVDRIVFSHRVRFLFSFKFKLFKNDKLPQINISDEVLIHFGDEIIYNTFDQNRLFIGITERINKNLTFDLGYMNVYQQKYTGYQYVRNHTIRLFFYYAPDLRKKKDAELPHYPVGGIE